MNWKNLVVGLALSCMLILGSSKAVAGKIPPAEPGAVLLASGLEGETGAGSTIGPDGALYVTEGVAGRISRVDPQTGEITTFASGLPMGNPEIGIGGVMDVAFIDETAYALVTLVGSDVGGSDAVGIYRVDGPDTFTLVADIGQFSLDNPPTIPFPYVVPTGVQYALETYRGGFLVTDGHLNRVLKVTLDGEISELIGFGDVVPTGLATRGNTVFMAEAGPVPHAPEDGKVVAFKFGPKPPTAIEVASGAPLLVDVEFGRGLLYALSQGPGVEGAPAGSAAEPNKGALVKVNVDGSLTVIKDGLDRPTSLEFIGNSAYVVTLTGEVWKIDGVSDLEVVASGLNNPRGIDTGPEGAVYVAEAGKGGGTCYDLFPPESELDTCLGLTGAITRIWEGQQSRVAQDMASLAGPDGFGAGGPVDISFQGRGGAYVIFGLGADPAFRDELAASLNPLFSDFGQLVRMDGSWKAQETVDVAAYEGVENPDGKPPEEDGIDSNPYAVNAIPSQRIVADAGGNDLLRVNNQGKISTLAVLPFALYTWPDGLPFGPPPGTLVPLDPVPTSIVQGPDGAQYVGQLASIGTDIANVYRLPPGGGDPEVYAGGFTAIIDIAFAPDGSLYVLEIAKNGLIAAELFGDWSGALIHVGLDGTRTEILSEDLFAPGGMTVASDGSIYVTNNSIFTDEGPIVGEVLRIPPGYQEAGTSASSSAPLSLMPQPNSSAFAIFGIDIDRILSKALTNRVFLPNVKR